MALLAEYALVPDVFDATCYTNEELCGVHLQTLKEVLLTEGIVRDLRNGEWLNELKSDTRAWHLRGKELLKKLVTQNRLRPHAPALTTPPTSDHEWCLEAIESHRQSKLKGIVTTDVTAKNFRGESLVASIHRLSNAKWWSSRSPSVRLQRNLADYANHLALVLACANSLMVIDPHLDPSAPRYRDAVELICQMGGRIPQPLIEIHRVCYSGSGQSRQIITGADWQSIFRRHMAEAFEHANLAAETFIWDDFHDRYIISDLVGIGLQNGLDTTTATQLTTWHRLGRDVRDDIQREFDPASGRHTLRHRFSVP